MSYVSKVIKFTNNTENTLQNTKHILLCGDKNYIKYCGVTLTSILLSNPNENFIFHIFCDDISEQDIAKAKATTEKFNTNIIIYYLDLDVIKNFSADVKGNDHISIATYFRFLAFGELYNYIDYVLYLDSDILVNGNINEFWNYKNNDKVAVVVEDISGKEHAKRVSVDRYFNAGVMFVDLKRWNDGNYTKLSIIKSNECKWQLMDQDVLNILLDKKILFISKIFNSYYSLSMVLERNEKPSLVKIPLDIIVFHFIGETKPWHLWVQDLKIVRKYNEVKTKSLWSDNRIITPRDMKSKHHKFFHKVARRYRKEEEYLKMIGAYWDYSLAKIKYLLKI